MIKLENVSYTYARKTPFESAAIRNLSLEISSGEFVGIMGATGSGKSTLLKIIDGLLTVDSGKVLINGKDINARRYDKNELRKTVGVVFQFPEYQLFESTVEREVAFGLRHLGLSREQKREKVRRALELVGFDYDKIRELSPFGFSGGEKRRLAIAGILACDPEVLILDEPIASLDPVGRTEFLELIKALNESGTTIIMISHNTDALCEYARRIIVMNDGRIIRDGSTSEVFGDYAFLKENKLGTSQVGRISELLTQKGIEIPNTITKYDELSDFLSHLLAERRGDNE